MSGDVTTVKLTPQAASKLVSALNSSKTSASDYDKLATRVLGGDPALMAAVVKATDIPEGTISKGVGAVWDFIKAHPALMATATAALAAVPAMYYYLSARSDTNSILVEGSDGTFEAVGNALRTDSVKRTLLGNRDVSEPQLRDEMLALGSILRRMGDAEFFELRKAILLDDETILAFLTRREEARTLRLV